MASKVVILGIYNDPNLGDRLICQSAAELIGRMAPKCEIKIADLYGRETLPPTYSAVKPEEEIYSADQGDCYGALRRLAEIMPHGSYAMRERACDIAWKIDPDRRRRLKKYYAEIIKDTDAVIIPGGGLLENSLEHDYYHYLNLIGEMCAKRNIPLLYNAVGAVNDKRSRLGDMLLRRALTQKSVKYISCRDGAARVEEYTGKKPKTVCCCASLSSQLMGVKRDEVSRRIGIGVVRENVFASYGRDLPDGALMSFYAGLVRAFEAMGYEPILFSNGYIKDYEFGQKVEERVGKKILLKRPEEPRELVEQIALFKAVCAARLHAVIAAYSLDIPAVAIAWGTKHEDFMKNACCPERAIGIEHLTAPYAASMTREAIRYGWNEERRRENLRSAYEGIKEILRTGGITDGR